MFKDVKSWCICFFLFPAKPDGTDLFNFVHGYPSWADYLRNMEKDGTWGDHLILRAAAKFYKTPIRVISSLDCDIVIDPDRLVRNTNPLVLGHIHEKHYVSLREGNNTTKMKLCFFGDQLALRLSEKSFVLAASRPKQQPLRGLTYSTLKFMRSTCGKSS